MGKNRSFSKQNKQYNRTNHIEKGVASHSTLKKITANMDGVHRKKEDKDDISKKVSYKNCNGLLSRPVINYSP